MKLKQRQSLIRDLQMIESEIDDLKLLDTPDYKLLKKLLNDKERIESKLDFTA